MADNSEILRQIALLSGALGASNSQKAFQNHSQQAHSYGKGRGSFYHPYARPVLGRGGANRTLITAHGARNRVAKLVNMPTPPVPPTPLKMNLAAPAVTPASRTADVSDSPKYIKKGNKLVRVGTAAALTMETPPRLVRAPPGAAASNVTSQNQSLVIVNGKAYTKGLFGRSLRKIATPAAPQAAQTPRTVKAISINGVEFVRASAGKKLIRKTNGTPVSKTPKRLVLNGQAYARAKSGNLVLMNVLRTPKRDNARTPSKPRTPRKHCQFYRAGTCHKGSSCRYIHDPARIPICPFFLMGKCTKNPCSLSHTPKKFNMPVCVHFERGRCTKESCPYLHVKLSLEAPVCRAFATEGFCALGDQCVERHICECPDFAATGKCPKAKCRLPHKPKRARPDSGLAGNKKSWWNNAQANANDAAGEEQEQLMRLPIRPNFALDGESTTDSNNALAGQDMDSMIPSNSSDDDQALQQENSDAGETDDDEAEEEDELESSEDDLDPALADTPAEEGEPEEDVIEILSDSDSEDAGGDVIDLTDE
ncbi:hypothetical protein BDZ88DRAFT_492984 [Geranomyces variabilis]|nr:hypothetical protein BDZ88DRAFT_492984 [Geranomyces variabilis]